MRNKQEIDEIVSDLMYIKNAISKNNNIFKFINLNQILRKVYLIGAILIVGFSSVFYYFIQSYGDYGSIPVKHRMALYAVMLAAVALVGYLKAIWIMKAAKEINRNISVFKLLREVYTAQVFLIMLPFIAALVFVPIFLQQNELMHLLVPFLSIFVGLICNSLVSVFYLKELTVLGGWLVVAGGFSLIGVISLHPLLVTIVTFGLGFLMLYLFSFLTTDSEKKC